MNTEDNDRLRARCIVAEQHKVLSLLGKSSWQEVVEDGLRLQLAEVQITLDALSTAAEGLLAFIRARYPYDFNPGGHGYTCEHHAAIAKALGRDDTPPALPQHVCGLQGFGHINDRCPRCDFNARRRQPPVQLQDGASPEWTCPKCNGDALWCGCWK